VLSLGSGLCTVVGDLFVFGRGDAAESAVQAPVVGPVHVLECGDLDWSKVRHGSCRLISSVLTSPIVDPARALS
jgi:hypothetical protein